MAPYTTELWETWNSSATTYHSTGDNTGNSTTWRCWNDSSGSIESPGYTVIHSADVGYSGTSNPQTYIARLETDEAKAEREQHEAEATQRRETRIQEAAEAQKKAEALLLSMLNEEQKEQYGTNKCFIVPVCGIDYRISPTTFFGVTRLGEDGVDVEKICAHVKGNVPAADNQLAVMLHLCNDHEGYLAIANKRLL